MAPQSPPGASQPDPSPPGAGPAGPADLAALQAALAQALHARGATADLDPALAAELLQQLGIPALVEDLAVAERIIRAADGFHPVARFFVDGSAEQRLITDVLRRGG